VIPCETYRDFLYGLKTISYFYHEIVPFIYLGFKKKIRKGLCITLNYMV